MDHKLLIMVGYFWLHKNNNKGNTIFKVVEVNSNVPSPHSIFQDLILGQPVIPFS